MSNSGRMNQFLQRMLRKPEEENKSGKMGHFERSKVKKSVRRYASRPTLESSAKSSGISRKSSFSKPAWMKKLGNSFDQPTKPIKVEIPKSPIFSIGPNSPKNVYVSTPKSPIFSIRPNSPKNVYVATPESTSSRKASCRKARTLPVTLNETTNVEHIVQEFESGFMSPTTNAQSGSGNFVKKIVAAFEEKYKSYNDSWSGRVRDKLKGSGIHRDSYRNICQSLHFTSVEISQSNVDGSQNSQSSQSCQSSQRYQSSTETLSTEDSGTEGLHSGPSNIQVISQSQACYSGFESQDPNSPNDHESSNCRDGTPFIIGAFLKKPIKVDETCINWIPFPGKKLPREKSLKKLLSTLTGKKSSEKKKEDVFASQVNVSEETRELPDSGYDEQSGSSSSSSLTPSTCSTPEVPNHEVIYVNVRNSTNMSTFKGKSTKVSTFQAESHEPEDTEFEIYSSSSKKLFLYEVPREDLKVDLGPCYPTPSQIMVKSLDRKVTSREKIYLPPLPKHPAKSTIPKHPFVSLSKDELNQLDDEEDVQIRNTITNFSSFQPSHCDYDVPKRFLSKSEPGIVEMLKFTFPNHLAETSHYDVPRLRPKSSVYDDALSLKRRNADFGDTSVTSHEYYSSPRYEKPNQYATIGSRNRRYLSPDICRSSNELTSTSMTVTVL